jgi:hypothetical protein
MLPEFCTVSLLVPKAAMAKSDLVAAEIVPELVTLCGPPPVPVLDEEVIAA